MDEQKRKEAAASLLKDMERPPPPACVSVMVAMPPRTICSATLCPPERWTKAMADQSAIEEQREADRTRMT